MTPRLVQDLVRFQHEETNMSNRRLFGALLLALMAALTVRSAAMAEGTTPRKPDLSDTVQGVYAGAVTSDSKGSSKSDVTITITRIGKNIVQITSDYGRLPEVQVRLSSAMGKILNVGGATTFFYDPAKSPPHLDLTFNNDVSWAGDRQ